MQQISSGLSRGIPKMETHGAHRMTEELDLEGTYISRKLAGVTSGAVASAQ